MGTMIDDLMELKRCQKKQLKNTHQVTPTTKISLPTKDARIVYSKPRDDPSSGSGGHEDLMTMMRFSMQRQFMEQEERAEQAKE